MTNLSDRVRAACALLCVLSGLIVFSATPTIVSVAAQQRYPWNGLVDIAVTFNGEQSEVAKANCTFAATNSATKTALAIAHVTQQGNDTGSGMTWTRRFIWDTNADLGEVKIDDVELFADVEVVEEDDGSGGVQLWEGGPYWATCNVGASKPEEYGLYFWWGDTVGHAGDWHFDEYLCCPTFGKSIDQLRSLGYIEGNLAPAHDAARAHWGAPWRMPTDAEFEALVSNCDTQWTTRNGVNGRLVKGRGGLFVEEYFPSRCRPRHRLLPQLPRLVRLLLVLFAEFVQFPQRVVPVLRFGRFPPGRLRPRLRATCSSSARICQVARELRAHSIDSD